MKTECDYLYGWIKRNKANKTKQNGHIHKNLTKNSEPQTYSWEHRRRTTVEGNCWNHFTHRKNLTQRYSWGTQKKKFTQQCIIFLTFFIHTVPLGRCALLTPHCWQFLASLLRLLAKNLSLFLDPLSGTHYHYPLENHSVLQLLKRNLRLIFFAPICAEVQVLVSVCITQEVCVCVCLCLSVCLSSLVCVVGYFYVRWCNILVLWVFFFLLNWMFQHDCLDTYCFWVSYMHAFLFLYLHLFSAIEHVSHGKAL